MQLEQPPREPDDEQQVLLLVWKRSGCRLALVEPWLQIGDIRPQRRETLPRRPSSGSLFNGVTVAGVAGLSVLVGLDREPELKRAIVEGLASHRRADGSYRLSNAYHYRVARVAV